MDDHDGSDDAALFLAHFPQLTRLALLLGAEDPENVAQEAFLRLHQAASRLRSPGSAPAYLRTTVVNLVRKQHRHLAVVRRHDRPQSATAVPSVEDQFLARDPHLEHAIAALTPRHREALVLRYWLDLSEKDMAESMGVSIGTVKSHVSRAMQAIRQALEKEPQR